MARVLERSALLLALFQITLRLCVSSGSGTTPNLLIHSLLWCSAAAWLASRALQGRWTLHLSGLEIPLAIIALLSLVSIARASYALPAIEGASAFTTLALTIPLAVSLFANRRALLVGFLNASLLTLALYALLQRFWILPALDIPTITNALDPETLIRLRSREVYATFFYPNTFAGFLVMLLPIAAGTFVDARDLRTRTVTGFALALGAAALGWTGALGGFIAIAIGTIVYLCLRVRRFWFTASCGVALLAGALLVGPRLLRTESMQIRSTYTSAALRIAASSPLGVGLNNFEEHYYQHRDARPYETKRVHNDYLQLLVELGIAGLIAWLAMLVLLARTTQRPPPLEDDRPQTLRFGLVLTVACAIVIASASHAVFLDVAPVAILGIVVAVWTTSFAIQRCAPGPATHAGLIAGLAAVCVHSLVDFDLYDYGTATVFGLLIALAGAGRTVGLGRRFAITAACGVTLIGAGWLACSWFVPSWDAERRTEQGMQALQHGDLETSLHAFQEAIRLRPRHAAYHDTLGQHLLRLNRPDEAHASFVRAAELFPTHSRAQSALARSLDRLGRYEEAVHHYRHALDLHQNALVDRQRLEPRDLIRALARTNDISGLAASFRSIPSELRKHQLAALPSRLGEDYDSLTRSCIDRAIEQSLAP